MSNRKQIAWRRNKTEDLLIKGNNQVQIAQILHVSEGTVSNDIAYLREESRKNMENHFHDRLPREYENCISGINQILKMSWDIATRDYHNSEINANSDKIVFPQTDDKTRLQALSLANDCYRYKIDLVTNGVIVADAVKFLQQKKLEVHKITGKNLGSYNNPLSTKTDPVENKTTNKIF